MRLFAVLRSLVYGAGFVLTWGAAALWVRTLGGPILPPLAQSIGIALMIAGGAIVLWCVGVFTLLGKGTPAPFDAPRSFVPSGPYRWVRNPMYVGAFTVLAGFGLLHRSVAMLLFVIPVALLFHMFVILYEEPTLQRRFGAEYSDYRTQVRRWIPRFPRRTTSPFS